MLIKSADDQSKRIAFLENLLPSDRLDLTQKQWLKDEIYRIKQGVRGERDAAHYIDTHMGRSPNHAIIHDLRIEHNGKVAQIDHLLINRTFEIYVLETKNYACNLLINTLGEFVAEYEDSKRFGIESPIEQNLRHIALLQGAVEEIDWGFRFGLKPRYLHAVLVHPKAIITRPDPKEFDTSTVIKADQIRTWYNKLIDKDNSIGSMLGMLKVVSGETLKDFATRLAALHRPANPLALPSFLAPREEPSAPAHKPEAAPRKASNNQYYCFKCEAKVTQRVADFCWGNKTRFGGKVYCFDHQKGF